MSGEGRPLRLARIKGPPADVAVVKAAWFARRSDHPVDGVRLLTLRGDDFVEQIFRGVDAWSNDPTAAMAAWEAPLNGYRDYAEPPSRMLDGVGAPIYPSSVARLPTDTDVSGAEQHVACTAAGKLRAVPPRTSEDPCATGLAPWLRKLYLPFHGDYQMAAFEVVCQRPSFTRGGRSLARVDPARIGRSGLIVRRLVPEAETETWEDWVHGGEGEGTWVRVADDQMRDGGVPIDPDALPLTGIPLATTLARLGCEAGALKLSLAPISPVPSTFGEADQHTAFVGMIPLAAEDVEASNRPDRDAVATHIERIAADLESTLDKRFHSTPLTALQLQAQQIVGDWVDTLLRGGLSSSGNPAEHVRFGTTNPTDTRKSELVEAWTTAALGRVARHLYETARTDPDSSDSPAVTLPTAADWWAAALDAFWTEHEGAFTSWSGAVGPIGSIEKGWFEDAITQRQTQFRAALHDAFFDAVALDVAAAAVPGSNAATLLAAMLVRVRSARAILYNHITLRLADLAPEAHAALHDRGVFSSIPPKFTQSSAADELTAWLEAERARDSVPVPWSSLQLNQPGVADLVRIHEQSAGLEQLLSRWEALASGLGAPFDAAMADHRQSWVDGLAGEMDPRDLGLDVDAQPARGLVAFPTADPALATTRVAQGVAAIRALKPPEAPAPLPPSTDRFLQSRQDAPLPRFDSRHLYAVWAFVEVHGHDCNEATQLVWSRRSEPFSIAEPLDVLGLEPTQIQLPDIPAMLRDLPRIPLAGANPYAAVISSDDGGLVGADPPEDSERKWGLAFVCGFAIPVFTICAWILFSFIFNLLIKIPGFFWMLLLKFCIPIPRRTA